MEHIKESLDRVLSNPNWCSRFPNAQVLINGSPSKSFKPNNGLRQGDPLSPYLFIICLEALSRLIGKGIKEKYITGISIVRGAPVISHSLYADDCIIFLKATYKNACNLRKILDIFCRWSGQVISEPKSTLLTSENLGKSFSRGMANALKVQLAKNPGKYLGIPLQWGRISEKTYSEMTEKMINKLQGWKTKNLNIAGRTTLLKSVLDPISNHMMSMFKLTKGLISRLNRYKKNFLRGGDKDRKGLHKIKWSRVCTPMEYGGLRIRDLELNNLSLLARMAWIVFDRPKYRSLDAFKG